MYILDIFFKRRKYTNIFARSWELIGKNISLSHDPGNSDAAELDVFYFVAVIYSTVYHAALAAGMSSSSAHYLARIQTNRNNAEHSTIAAAQELFAVPDDEQLMEFATFLNAKIYPLVTAVATGSEVDASVDCKPAMQDLYEYFQRCEFSPTKVFPAGK